MCSFPPAELPLLVVVYLLHGSNGKKKTHCTRFIYYTLTKFFFKESGFHCLVALPWSRYVTGSLGLLIVTVTGPRQSAPAIRSLTPPVCCPQVAVVFQVSAPAFSLYVKLPTLNPKYSVN